MSAESNAAVKEVYQLIDRATGFIGGNAYQSAMYGELRRGSMQEILDTLKEKCELSSNSNFIDIGSGLGKPNFHAAQLGVNISIGVELVNIRHQLCMQNLHKIIKADDQKINVRGLNFINADITKATSLKPFTHIYQFDLGFEPPLQEYIASMFNQSDSCQYLISYRRPLEIERYGYLVDHVTDINTNMSGSGESHKAYFYKKNLSKAESAPETTATIKAEYVLVDELECDALFANPIEISMKKEALTEYCTKFVEEYFAQSRPVRTVKSPVKYDASVYTSPVRPRGRTEVDVETAGISSLKETLEKEDKKGDQTPVRKTDKEAQLSPLRVRSKSPEPGYKTPPRTPSTRRQSAKVQSAVEPIRSLAEEERHGSLTPSKKAVSNSAKKSLTPLKTDAVLSSPKRGVKVN